MKLKIRTIVIALTTMVGFGANAQISIKTNALEWATTTPNIGIEAGISRHSTIQVSGALNPWNFAHDHHFRFWSAQPEYRYWFCETFNGHFVGVHLLGGQYNAKKVNFPLRSLTWGKPYEKNDLFPEKDHTEGFPDIQGENSGRHVEGWYIGAGVTYGYQWMLSKHWNLEASIGVGYTYSPLTYYGRCSQIIDKRHVNYVGPTNAQISFLYFF